MMISELWGDRAESDARVAEVRAAWQQLEPYTDGFYVNAMTDDMYKGVRAKLRAELSAAAAAQEAVRPREPVPAQCEHHPGVGDSTTSSAAAGRAQ